MFTIHTLTIDSDDEVTTSIHATELDALNELSRQLAEFAEVNPPVTPSDAIRVATEMIGWCVYLEKHDIPDEWISA